MRRIVVETEQHLGGRNQDARPEAAGAVPTELAIAAATVAAVHMLQTPVVVAFTKSGFSARIVSSYRPGVPILALTDQERTYRQLALMWGVVPELVPHCDTYDQMMVLAKEAVVRRELAAPGDRIVVTAGVPFDVPGTTNILKVERV
jgi:pyruvate kinase